LNVRYISKEEQRTIRGYGDHPRRTEKSIRYVVHVERNEKAIRKARLIMGWRLYVTNAEVSKLSLSKAVNVFRKSPVIERNFSRLKGRPLGVHPLHSVQTNLYSQRRSCLWNDTSFEYSTSCLDFVGVCSEK